MNKLNREDLPEIPLDQLTPQQESILKQLETLVYDLEVEGWDIDSRIYFIQDDNSPFLHFAGIMPTHPIDDMIGGFDQGLRVPPDALGLAIAGEGYRHLSFEEVIERAPEMLPRILDMAEQKSGARPDEDLTLEVGKNHYYDVIIPRLPGPSEMPDHMRAEMRIITAVLRDGTGLHVTRSRGKDDITRLARTKECLRYEGIPGSMYLFLHGLRPEVVEDPVQAVSDYQLLKAMEE